MQTRARVRRFRRVQRWQLLPYWLTDGRDVANVRFLMFFLLAAVAVRRNKQAGLPSVLWLRVVLLHACELRKCVEMGVAVVEHQRVLKH